MTLDELNAAPEAEVRAALEACCGSSRWVAGMAARRPFASSDAILTASDEIWASTGPDDWLEAFSHHPRIGEKTSQAKQSALAARWSGGEQSSAGDTTSSTQDALAEANRAYEARFGYIYIICATGRTAEEMLDIATRRLNNDPEAELRIAAGEQHRITRIRLAKLLGENAA